MPYGHVIAHHARVFIGDMAHTVVLDVRVMADNDPVNVAAQHAAEPDARLFPNLRVTNHPRAVGDEYTGTELRLFAEVLEEVAHGANSAMLVAKCKADLARFVQRMTNGKPTPPKWIIVRLGGDLNWWLDEASTDVYWGEGARGVLDPRQVEYLVEMLEEYQPYGFQRQLLDDAFQLFQLESELDDDRLRLAPADQDEFDGGGQLFALPLVNDEETGVYYDFLDALSAARIRKLNATHHYARDCTELEMQEELAELDRDRYVSAENIHSFDAINEILQWSPAEWDEPDS